MCVCVCVCVCCACVCACVCARVCARVCVMERLLPQFQAWLISAWCSVDTYQFTNVQMCI